MNFVGMGRSLGPHRPASGKLQLHGVAEEKVVSDVHVGEDRTQNFANPGTTSASSRAFAPRWLHLFWDYRSTPLRWRNAFGDSPFHKSSRAV